MSRVASLVRNHRFEYLTARQQLARLWHTLWLRVVARVKTGTAATLKWAQRNQADILLAVALLLGAVLIYIFMTVPHHGK